MKIIADQKEEIAELRKHITDVEKKQQKQEEYIHHQLERDQKLMKSLRKMQEEKQKELAATAENTPKKSWWNRLFK
ncbi:DUF3967 domain-containing protein [Oceanobacillus rekensis]|uniref:DUF3967 domain-containing protein n=1 Tax=Oceanobacillus rekensis TaxID=937927 RepID=UPI0015935DB3|nr:DUF3967 domain-containing protein [Oceanobacillus rekensis]